MKRVLLLTTIGVLCFAALSKAQDVFDPNDELIRYNANAALGSPERPNPAVAGLQKWVAAYTQGVSNSWDVSSFKAYFYNMGGGAQMAFRLKWPKSFHPDSAAAGKKWPVMVFFHGAGEPGCPSNGGIYNNEKQMQWGGKLFRDRVDNGQFDGFLLYPQNVTTAGGTCWNEWGLYPYVHYYNAVVNVIDSIAKYEGLDIDRVLVTGLSNGGAADWILTANFPQRVTKVAPSAAATGATNYSDFVHIPIWFATGGKDNNPDPNFANGTYQGIKNAGANITWTLFENLGHSVWDQHWTLPGFVEWMNDLHKANPLVYFQRYDWCPDSAIAAKIGITRGFYEYEWERNGELIARAVRTGSNSYSHQILKPEYIVSFTANDITVDTFGTYRVRFRRVQNGPWSQWSPKPAVISPKPVTTTPPIAVHGLRSKVLPAPDGSSNVPLILPPNYRRYEWYRNGSLISTDSIFLAVPGNYTAKTYEPFGCGSIFSPEFKVVAANGEPKPDPATNLKAVVENSINVKLTWDQNPNAGQNETGFEIYRATSPGGPYTLIHITGPDATSYLDQNLASNVSYSYIVRAVSDFGAAANSNEATVVTPADNQPPTPPSGLEAVCITRNKIVIRWNPSIDNIGVSGYDIYINGVRAYSTAGTNNRFEILEVTPLTNYAIVVKAKDAAGNHSQPSNQITAYTKAQGLCYKVYQGDWNSLPDFNQLVPIKEGMAPNVDLSVRPAGLNDYFGMLWEGHIFRVSSTNSTRRFQICSDDGSRFYWNTQYNPSSSGHIDHNGLHSDNCKAAGSNVTMNGNTAYPIALAYFEKNGGEALRLQWRIGTSGSYVNIPNEAFTESGSPGGSAPSAPTGLSANAPNYHSIQLSWTDNSNNETGFEIVRSTSLNGVYVPVATVTQSSFVDTSLNASTTYFYKVRSINNNGQSAFTTAASATTQPAPPAPVAPTNLVASVPGLNTIQLTWNDNSENETGFEIWRSVGNNTEFSLLTTVAGGPGSQKTYIDAPVFANVHYFYKVRATGAPTPSAFTGEASAATANTPPVLNPIPNFTVRQGESVSVPVTASDVDGDPLQFTALNLPWFATIENVSNGNANIVANPPAGVQGVYNVRMVVADGFNGYDTVRFSLIVNNNSVPVIDPINDVLINEGDSLEIAVSAHDDAVNSALTWSFENLPSWISFTDNGGGHGTLKLKPHYAASGIYNVTMKVRDAFGGWSTRSFGIVVNEVDPNESIRVNMNYWTLPVAGWNHVLLGGNSTFNLQNMVNIKGQVTTVGINLVSAGSVNGTDHGAQANGNGIFPDAVIKDQLKIGYNGGPDQAVLRVYGLDPNGKYNFVFFASEAGYEDWRGYNANTVTTFTINGISVQSRVLGNINRTDTIYQIQPNASGEVFITMTGDPSPMIGAILNALIIDKQVDDGTVPIKPQNLSAYTIPNQGVRLTWNDIAYNESSYRIYRATNLAGPYTVITPDAQKDSVTYLDKTVEPFTQYYYFLRGVNYLGMSEPSDTVTIFTANNNPLINGLTDMYVKAEGSGQQTFSVSDDVTDVLTVSILKKPSFVQLVSLGNNQYRIDVNPVADHIGTHYMTVRVTDNHGGEATQGLAVHVSDNNTRSVYINLGWSAPAPAPWNNFLAYGNAGNTLNNLRDESNNVTPFGIQLLTTWDNITEMGHRTGNNSGVFPDSVLASGIADDGITSDGTNTLRFKFTGLNNSKRYNIVLVGSQNEGMNAISRYSSGSQVDTLNARNNTNGTANLNGLTPVNGEIEVSIRKVSGSTYIFLNGIQLEEFDPSITLMAPANLYAEPRQDRNSIQLIWSDRSYNETGFQLQRATDSLFTQNVVNINLGVGASTYTNTGLQPNTKYWYRIRARGAGNTFSAWSNRVKAITPQSVVYINFTFTVPGASTPWNNLDMNPMEPATATNFVNQDNMLTNLSLSIVSPFSGENITGLTSSGGIVPGSVMESSFWIDRAGYASVKLSGLNQTKRYRLGFTANLNNDVFGGNMTMVYRVNGRSVYLNAYLNSSKMVYIGDLVPDENGELLVEFTTPDKAGVTFGFISAMVVQSYDDVQGGSVINSNQPVDGAEELVRIADYTQTEEAQKTISEPAVYPNPFRDIINLEFNNASGTNKIAVDVYDMTGRLVYRRDFGTMAAGYTLLRVNAAEAKLNPGVYMVTLTANGKMVKATKMIKARN